MLYIKSGEKIWMLDEHQLGILVYSLILLVWFILKSSKKEKFVKRKKKYLSKLKNDLLLKKEKLRLRLTQKRIKWLKKRREKLKEKIEELQIIENLILQKQTQLECQRIELIFLIRGGESIDSEDKRYLNQPDFARCSEYIDPDHVYEIYNPIVLKYVRKLIPLDKKNPQIIDIGVALAASYKSRSVFRYSAGIALSITIKSKGLVKNIIDTAIIWSPNNFKQYIIIFSYVLAGLLTTMFFNILVINGLPLMQIGGGLLALVSTYLTSNEIVSALPTSCHHIISEVPASNFQLIPTVQRPISYVLEPNPSTHRVFVVGDKNLIVQKFSNKLPDYCRIGENYIDQKENPFGDNFQCLEDEQKCQSILEDVSQKIENSMCKDNLKNFEEATEICARKKQTSQFKIHNKKNPSSYHLRGQTQNSISKRPIGKKCYPRHNVPLGRRTKTLADLRKQDREEFLNSEGATKLQDYNERSRKILRERYNLD